MGMGKSFGALAFAAAAVSAAGAAAFLLNKKQQGKDETGSTENVRPLQVKMEMKGVYSFVSGFENAKTVEAVFPYDGEKYSFEERAEDFLIPTSDSHVGIMCGEDFNAQIEYSELYGGETFETLEKTLKEKYKGFEKRTYGTVKAYKYLSGDGICLCIDSGAEGSYILMTVIPAKGSDETAETLPANAYLAYTVSGIKTSVKE